MPKTVLRYSDDDDKVSDRAIIDQQGDWHNPNITNIIE